MKTHDNYNGIFISNENQLSGHLIISGTESIVKLIGESTASRTPGEYEDIYGLLADGSRASLLSCVPRGWTEHHVGENSLVESSYFPNYVVIGGEHVGSNEPVIRAVRYHFENADSLVSGYKTFTSLSPNPEDVRKLLEEDHKRSEQYAKEHGWPNRSFEPEIGEHPHLVYYSGKWEIVASDTDLGKISLTNRTSHGMGTAAGIGFNNEVTANIEFAEPKTIRDAIRALYTLHGLFEVSLGHRQRYRWIELELTHRMQGGMKDFYQTARLYWSFCNERVEGNSRPHLMDVLLAPDRRQEEFTRVVTGWMDSTATMGDPRERFATAFFGKYGIDRIVGAANMFDLLPESHAPKKKEPDTMLEAAVQKGREIFAALPDSTARQSMLSALGRVGTASLRDKVYHRADIVKAAMAGKFPDLYLPCNLAVLARNHYVHGSPASFDYRDNFTEFTFLTDTLEFVFAASDLIEIGWDLSGWIGHGTTMTHAFGTYIVNYQENMRRLKILISK